MIYIEKLRFKNVASTGNHFTEFDFTDCKNILIVGANGRGKSTVLQALSFAMFGKPFTKIKISELVNEINKHLETELFFRNERNSYRIVRNLKPDSFEIYENDILLEKPGKKEDYQKILDRIYGFDFKTFTIAILHGSATYTPFMQLEAKDRRIFTEKLLDLEVISVMSEAIKSDLKQNKSEVQKLESEINALELSLQTLLEKNKRIREDRQKQIQEFQDKIRDCTNKKVSLNIELEKEQKLLEGIVVSEYQENRRQVQEKLKIRRNENSRIEAVNNIKLKKLQSISSISVCPECQQVITPEQKQILKDSYTVEEINRDEEHVLEQRLQKLEINIEKIRKKQEQIRQIQNSVIAIDREIAIYNNEINKNEVVDEDRERQIQIEINQKVSERNEKLKQQKIREMSVLMLKDDGIKTEIIQRYLPFINESINKYLQEFGMFMRFELNAEFEEVFKSRHVQNRTYNSFSEGEKKRIDLSILFAFKEVSQRKHKIACSLVCFDEIFEKVDEEGVQTIIKLLRANTNTNIVITHEQELINSFNGSRDRIVQVEKRGNFSTYKFLN
jgi:DNA repair exonuclease SbcCD ATPase subunit